MLPQSHGKAQSFQPGAQPDSGGIAYHMKAKFVKRIMNEYCGIIHIPERNMFETFIFSDGQRIVKTIIEVEYSTGCTGSHLDLNQTYTIMAVRVNRGSIAVYKNIYTTVDVSQYFR